MPSPRRSLLAGRNQAPLSDREIRRATNTFLGIEQTVATRYDSQCATAFRVSIDADGEEYGEIVFGPDIYPGKSVIDANSALSLTAAVAHELTHYHRWRDGQALPDIAAEHLDEALTSLQAIHRYHSKLNEVDVRQLVADAASRIQLFVEQLSGAR